MTSYGIIHTDAINSCWYVVDAVNSHPNFKIAYPEEHDKQQSIAEGFRHSLVPILHDVQVQSTEC
jgi:hypothetical protein